VVRIKEDGERQKLVTAEAVNKRVTDQTNCSTEQIYHVRPSSLEFVYMACLLSRSYCR
jgi:hypothetical protein